MNEEHAAPEQYWVRTQAGQVMGPLTFVTIEMLAGQGIFGDTCEVSLDGMLFAPVGEMPVIRDAFPRSMWGESPQEEPVQVESLDLEPSAPGVALDFGPAPLFELPPSEEAAGDVPVTSEMQLPAGEPELDGLEDLALELETMEPPAPASAPEIPRAPVSFVAPRVHAAPAGERVHQAPAGERVHAAPAGEPAARLHEAPAGAVAPRSAPDPVQEGVPLPELIPSGRLVPGTGLRLYYLVAVSRSTGLLTLTPADGGSFGVFFKKGKPEQVRTDDARHSLSSHLVRTGKLSAEKAIEAEAARGRFGGEVVNALFALGLLDPSQAFALLAEHGRTALEQALRIDAGRFEWDPSAPLPGGTMPLGAPLALLGAAGRMFDPAQAFVRLGSRIDCPVIRAGDGLAEIADLALTAVEARVVAAFDGTRSLAEIAAASPSDAGLVYRLGWFLGEVGFASFARAVRPRPENTPLLGPAPPLPGEQPDMLTDPELDALAAPMPPPGTVLAPGLDTSGPAAPVMPRVAAGAAPAPAQPPPATFTPGPPTLTPGPAGYTPGPPAASPFAAPPPPPPSRAPPSAPATSTPGAFTPGAFTPGAFTPGAQPRSAAPASPFEPGPSPLPRQAPVRTPGPFTGQTPAPPRGGAPRPAAAVPTPGPASVADEATLRKLLDRMTGQDHFAALGLTRAATSGQVKQAYLKLAREHHPDTAGPAAPPEVRHLKEQITARLNEAYQELGTDEARSAYVASLSAGAKGKQVDLSSILAAEEAFNMAAILVKARKYGDALAELARAIELNAEEGEFYAWRGFARFSAATDKRSVDGEAMADIKKALKLNPRCAVAHLFAARIAQVLGNGAEAARSFRRCLELDPQNLEAQRELRLLESRANR